MDLTDLPPLDERAGSDLLLMDEAATYLRVPVRTLETWRLRRTNPTGPAYIRLGNGPKAPIRYEVAALRTWLAERRIDPAMTAR